MINDNKNENYNINKDNTENRRGRIREHNGAR